MLRGRGVTFGINESIIKAILEKGKYNCPVLVAKGKEKQDGKDGWFDK